MSEEKVYYTHGTSLWSEKGTILSNGEWDIGIPKDSDYYKYLHIDEWIRDSYWEVK